MPLLCVAPTWPPFIWKYRTSPGPQQVPLCPFQVCLTFPPKAEDILLSCLDWCVCVCVCRTIPKLWESISRGSIRWNTHEALCGITLCLSWATIRKENSSSRKIAGQELSCWRNHCKGWRSRRDNCLWCQKSQGFSCSPESRKLPFCFHEAGDVVEWKWHDSS